MLTRGLHTTFCNTEAPEVQLKGQIKKNLNHHKEIICKISAKYMKN